MFHLCPTNVASKCFMLQVFRKDTLSDERMAPVPRDGARQSWVPTDGGAASWGPAPRSRPCGEREDGLRGRSRVQRGTGCACEAGAGCAAIHPGAKERRGRGASASRSETDGCGLRVYQSGCPDASHADF
jgi:hypothetical protein